MLEFKEQQIEQNEWETPRWQVGIDQRHVIVYIGLALVAGFAFGFAVARYMTGREAAAASSLASAERTKQTAIPAVPTASQPESTDFLRVTSVLRADTIEVEGIGQVRMIGIETPDGKTPTEIYAAHGASALAFTKSSLEGKEVRLQFDPVTSASGNKNESGQTLAYVYTRDGTLFNAEMIKLGHAFVKVADQFQAVEDFRAMERDAMQGMRGVWGLGGAASTTASTQPAATSPAPDETKSRKLQPMMPSELGPNVPAIPTTSAPSEPMVFVSSADRMYHKSGCDYLDKKKTSIPLSKAKSDGYTACGRCFASTVLKAP